MNFWKKWQNKKELKKKLEKARFVNFYGNEIDLSLGRIITAISYDATFEDYEIIEYSIILKYDNFKEIFLSYGQMKNTRDEHIRELISFASSDKFTEYLNNYENLKREYEQL